MDELAAVQAALRQQSDPQKARVLQGFFKTGPGEYGEGDIFIGVVVPELRKLARRLLNQPVTSLTVLLRSPVHEERLLGLLSLVQTYQAGTPDARNEIFQTYITHVGWINNWDLVDLSAPLIVGAHLAGKDKALLGQWAGSKNLWERRIAVLATFFEIRQGRFQPTLRIARRLLRDPEDLIHKAVGWMLREIGKRNVRVEDAFLERHASQMPRTMLRYAIEKFPETKRHRFLKQKKTR